MAAVIVFYELEAVRLHIACVEKLRSANLFGKISDDLYRCRLRQHRLLPRFVVQRRALEAPALVSGPFRLFTCAYLEPSVLVCIGAGFLQSDRKTIGYR